jgi:hypothetical protein
MSKTDPNGVEMLRTMARTVAPLAFSRQSQRIEQVSTIPCCGLAYNVAVDVERHGSLPWYGKLVPAGLQRTARNDQRSKRLFCLQHQTTRSNWVTSGVVCRRPSTNGGCGQQCAAEPTTSSPLPLETEARATCLRFWEAIPHDSKHGHTFSDCWHVSHHVFPAETHHGGGKEPGEPAQMERWNKQRPARASGLFRSTHVVLFQI